MKKIKAFRKSFRFLKPEDSDRYLLFIKEHFTSVSPKFYSIIAKTKVETSDGIMYAIRFAEDLSNPNYEPIAECLINGLSVYLWREHCWVIADDKHGKDIIIKENIEFNKKSQTCNKIMVIHRVDNKPVFEENQ